MLKAATVYNCVIPDASELETILAENMYHEAGSLSLFSTGFIPVEGESFTRTFSGWLHFAIQHEEKIIPATTVRDEMKKRIEKIESEQCRKIFRAEKLNIKDEIVIEFCKRALSKHTKINAYYHKESSTMLVDTASEKNADRLTASLLHAVGSIKATTIYISGIKDGLTNRLYEFVTGDDTAFGKLTPVAKVKLIRMDSDGAKESVTVSSGEELLVCSDQIQELINQERFEVAQLGFNDKAVSFMLDDKFRFRSIKNMAFEPDETDDESYDASQHELEITLHAMLNNSQYLCETFEYKAPEEVTTNGE
jgi:recombination associated protein RdgC